MIKRISFLRRKEGMSQEDFFAHWTGPHADIVRQMPGLRGLRFGRVQSWTPEDSAWDGVGEIWFDSEEDALKAFATEPYKSLLAADRPKFTREIQACFVTEQTVVRPPAIG
ncbi:MAG: EthD family reductase [Rhizobiales bacterium]|nr:EthD family reductase [Hyphomicrobiales bacterium]